jgi:hypothetical protein
MIPPSDALQSMMELETELRQELDTKDLEVTNLKQCIRSLHSEIETAEGINNQYKERLDFLKSKQKSTVTLSKVTGGSGVR